MLDDDIESISGIGSSTAKKLISAGYPTIESIAVSPPKEIQERSGVGLTTVLKIQEAAREMISVDFMTAQEAYERRQKMLKCTTGSPKMDELLGGGVETQAVTEFIGEYRTGKTQICLTLCATAQMPPEKGGLGGNVAFVDTEGTFMPERVYQIAQKRGLDPAEIAGNIHVARAYNCSHQCLLIEKLFSLCKEHDVKLVVVDSMISHFRGEYAGRGNLADRQQKLNKYLHKLVRVAEAYNIAVVLTNQVQANPDPFWARGDPNQPAGGNVMAHACTHRIYLRKGKDNTRTVTVIDSPSLPEEKTKIMITDKGIEDAPDD